jgi:hypothetical protein
MKNQSNHFNRLVEMARRHRVQVHFLPAAAFPDVRWFGLYIMTPHLGAGIAIRDDLTSELRDWIFAHEMGHHFSDLSMRLFSPFAAHSVDEGSIRRWVMNPKADPQEHHANEWAIKTLVTQEDWETAERQSPCDLHQVVARLGLPTPAAAAWERLQRSQVYSSQEITVTLSRQASLILSKPIRGRGGHQSFFRRLQRSKRGRRLRLSFADFSHARERALYVRGGWQVRYSLLLAAVAPAILAAGSVSALFRCRKVGRFI